MRVSRRGGFFMRRTTIDEAIARVDDWKGREISYKPVSGGITNP